MSPSLTSILRARRIQWESHGSDHALLIKFHKPIFTKFSGFTGEQRRRDRQIIRLRLSPNTLGFGRPIKARYAAAFFEIMSPTTKDSTSSSYLDRPISCNSRSSKVPLTSTSSTDPCSDIFGVASLNESGLPPYLNRGCSERGTVKQPLKLLSALT